MDNVYLEYMIKRETVPMDWVKRIGGILLGIILCAAVMILFTPAFAIVFVAAIWGNVFLWRRLDKEYEYIYTDGNLDVDCVFHRSSRKRMVSIDCREFEVVAPAGEERLQSAFERKYDKVLDAGRGGIRENTYIAICNREGNTLKLLFEPSDAILEAMRHYIPRTLVLPNGRR